MRLGQPLEKLDPAPLAFQTSRRLGGRVLVSDESGSCARLDGGEHDALLSGGPGPAWLLRDGLDLSALAAELAARGWPGWRAPLRFLIILEKGGRRMELETVKTCVDFAFSAPGAGAALELRCEDAARAWPALWLAVQYARRRSEWSRRPVSFSLRAPAGLPAAAAQFVIEHSITRQADLRADGAPPRFPLPEKLDEIRLLVGKKAARPGEWADWLASCSAAVRLVEAGSEEAYLKFFGGFLDRLKERDDLRLRELTSEELLAGAPWALRGMDVSSELCLAPDGGVFTSERAFDEELDALRIGRLPGLRYDELASSPAVRAALSAAQADHQPLCAQCAYRGHCAVPPSTHLSRQGAPWGELPNSAACRSNMALLDRFLFPSK
jgi:hypothetical protein